MILDGNNLGERHRDLNSKVTEAVANQTNFDELKIQPDTCDVDKLFKIDVASKYKNIEYILDVLKCGDVFYITRALKCLWLFTDEYSRFINPEYLETNIFPSMSNRMKNKTLTTISIHVRNAERAADFYKYCEEAKLYNHAVKFLIFTSDSFKLHVLNNRGLHNLQVSKFLKQFIDSSFDLARAYIRYCTISSYLIQELRFLYSVSEEKYLDILEYIKNDSRNPRFSQRLGLRISKDILNKHKQRVLNTPLLYVNILNKSMLLKYLTGDDVESLAFGLLPTNCEDFWYLDFYNTYKYILDKIDASKLYSCIKQIYQSKYDGDEFEMRIEFYNLKYYEMLNIDEREAWALRHIERDEELPGIKNYIWYKFVSCKKAFTIIKRYIFLTPDKDERAIIVNILPETARNQTDINDILSYYYERHINENENHKESFINKIIAHHDIYSFNNECWTSLDKLFYSLDVYTTGSYTRSGYKFRSTIYHILHDIDLLEVLKEYIETLSYYSEPIIDELSEERKVIVAQYLCKYFAHKIRTLMEHPDYNIVMQENEYWNSGSVNNQIHNLVNKIWNILKCFKRPNEECPEIVIRFMESNMGFYQYHEKYIKYTQFEKKSEADFVRWLKQDIELTLDGIDEIRCNTYRWDFRLCRLFRKLKVYFPNDIGEEYLDYFMEYLSDIPKTRREYRNIKMAVVGVFYLADTESIISFLNKNAPTSPKIDHKNIDHRLLQVQKAICRLSYRPRPPLPLSVIQKYITGDYVHYCLPMFYNYFVNLPSNEKFIESLIGTPLSIQKHGLRLAFKAYDADILKPIIIRAWRNTKNVSLRMVLYETLFDRLLTESKEVQKQLYEVLKLYTSQLNHDDHDKVYSLLVFKDLPDVFKGDFIETAWLTVNKLSDKNVDIKRRISVVCHMETYFHLVQREFPRLEIIDDHVNSMLREKNINKVYENYLLEELHKAKWDITAKYIVSCDNKIEQEKSLQVIQTIMTEALQSWNLVKNKTYTLRNFMHNFIKTIINKDPKTIQNCENVVPIYKCIRSNLKSFLKEEDFYLLNWQLKLSIICRNIIMDESRKRDIDPNYFRRPIYSNEIGNVYRRAVAEMVKGQVENDNFHHCFYQRIADIVNSVGYTVCNILGTGYVGFVYHVCDSLAEVKKTETHILALYMLPRDPPYNCRNEHENTVNNIKNQSINQEVQNFLCDKYVMSDYEVRDYVN